MFSRGMMIEEDDEDEEDKEVVMAKVEEVRVVSSMSQSARSLTTPHKHNTHTPLSPTNTRHKGGDTLTEREGGWSRRGLYI